MLVVELIEIWRCLDMNKGLSISEPCSPLHVGDVRLLLAFEIVRPTASSWEVSVKRCCFSCQPKNKIGKE